MFRLTREPIDGPYWLDLLADPGCGAFVVFEGRVRNHHQGRQVKSLEYEAYERLAITEGERILASIKDKYGLRDILCVHRTGHLAIGETAIWLGASSGHREEAFAAMERAMDEIKTSVPIWKREHYLEGEPAWVLCHEPGHGHGHPHVHPPGAVRT